MVRVLGPVTRLCLRAVWSQMNPGVRRAGHRNACSFERTFESNPASEVKEAYRCWSCGRHLATAKAEDSTWHWVCPSANMSQYDLIYVNVYMAPAVVRQPVKPPAFFLKIILMWQLLALDWPFKKVIWDLFSSYSFVFL